ncbi:MAG: type 4a pilus biogenesis protein PilO [Blastocatellia bacterium]|nr:type 4a pilus biogenesis protein PilO [Blastocatellia bacterium]
MAEGRGFLGNIPWWGQLLILVALVFGLWYLVDLLAFSDVRLKTDGINKEADTLHEENRQAEQVRAQLADYQRQYQQALDELKVYRERLPEEVKISETLAELQQKAQSDTLIIRAFKPKAATSKEFYKEKPVEVQVGATYANLGKFFEDIANFKRIVQVTDVDIKKASPQTTNLTIESSFTLTTYFASEADVLNMPADAPAKK